MENDCHDKEFGKIRIQNAQVSLKMLHEAKSDLIPCKSSKHTRSSRGLRYEEGMYQDPEEEGYENNNRQHYKMARECELCGKFISKKNMRRHQKMNCTALKNLGD